MAGRDHIAPSLRDFRVDDTDKIAGIWSNCMHHASPKFDADFIAEERANLISHYLPNTDTTVAVVDHVPVGFISMNRSEIAGLFVSPQYQRHGIGAQLVAHMDQRPQTVEVLADDPRAVAFYRSLGFTQIGTRDHETARRMLIQMQKIRSSQSA